MGSKLLNFRFSRTMLVIVSLVAISAVSASLLWQALHWGVWAYSDSTAYIVSARMLLDGRGLGIPGPQGFSPLMLHPPLYPLLICVMILAGIEPLDGLVWLNLVLLVCSVFLAGFLIYKLTNISWEAILSSALIGFSPAVIRNFDGAMTEPVYLFLSVVALLLMAAYLQKPGTCLLLLAGLSAGLAGLTRYVGVALVGSGIVIALCTRLPWKKRLTQAGIFLVLGAGPLVVWLINLFIQTGSLAARQVSAGGDIVAKMLLFRKSFVEVLVSWVPYTFNLTSWRQKSLALYALVGLGIAAAIVAAWLTWKNSARRPELLNGLKLAAVSLLSAISFVLFLAGSYFFSSVTPDINERTMLPLLPPLFIFLCVSFSLSSVPSVCMSPGKFCLLC